MRASIKIGDKWETHELPADPEQLSKWLWDHDGQQVVVSDDGAGIFYCARHEEYKLYEAKDKTVKMFRELDLDLRAQMPAVKDIFDKVNAVFPGAAIDSLQFNC